MTYNETFRGERMRRASEASTSKYWRAREGVTRKWVGESALSIIFIWKRLPCWCLSEWVLYVCRGVKVQTNYLLQVGLVPAFWLSGIPHSKSRHRSGIQGDTDPIFKTPPYGFIEVLWYMINTILDHYTKDETACLIIREDLWTYRWGCLTSIW